MTDTFTFRQPAELWAIAGAASIVALLLLKRVSRQYRWVTGLLALIAICVVTLVAGGVSQFGVVVSPDEVRFTNAFGVPIVRVSRTELVEIDDIRLGKESGYGHGLQFTLANGYTRQTQSIGDNQRAAVGDSIARHFGLVRGPGAKLQWVRP